MEQTGSQLTLEAALTNLEVAESSWLTWARSFARTYALLHGSVSSDTVREECDRLGFQPADRMRGGQSSDVLSGYA